jgi:serine/threonine protein kinase, bacterial
MMWQKHVQLGKHMSYVLSRMLEVSVRDRYQTAQETIDALNNESIGEVRQPVAPAVRQQTSAAQPGTIGQARHPGMPPAPAPPPVQPTVPTAQGATMSATQRMAERIKKQKDLTGIRNGDPTKMDAGGNTGFGATPNPAPTVRRPLQKMDAPAVLNAFKKGQRTFNDIDLSNLQLPGAHLPGITLVKANCTQSNFQGANLAAGKFESANFSDAVLRDASLSKTYFSHANLQNADLRGADLSDAYLKFANLQGTNLCGANLKGVNVTEEQLNTAKTNFMTVFPNGKRGGFW